MGNVVGSQTETNARDDGNQKITEARKRYLQEKFEKDDETAISDADSSREPGYLLLLLYIYIKYFNKKVIKKVKP